MMSDKKLIEILKSGNFTVRYDDNGSGTIIEGRFNEYEDTYNERTGKNLGRSTEFGGQGGGYAPEEVEWLVEALGGKVVSV